MNELPESDKVQHMRNTLLELARSGADCFVESIWRGARCARVGRIVGVTTDCALVKMGDQTVCWHLSSITRCELAGSGGAP